MNRLIFIAAGMLLCLSSCTKDHTAQIACVTCQPISFKSNIVPIFTASCATSGCHDPQDAEGGLILDSAMAYSNLFSDGYVVDSNASASTLYNVLLPGASERMPQVGSLDNCSIHEIYCWIEEGAPNN